MSGYSFTAGSRNLATWCEALEHAGAVARNDDRIVAIYLLLADEVGSARGRTLLATVGPNGRVVTHR